MTKYLLCGLPMSGKSTMGELAAKALRWPYLDLDKEIEKAFLQQTKASLTCREIYQREGALSFRKRERAALMALPTLPKAIISLGGGTLEDPLNCESVRRLGVLIYLKEDPKLIWERMLSQGFPAYLDPEDPKKSFFSLAEKRAPIYEREAHRVIEIRGRPIEAILKEFLDGI